MLFRDITILKTLIMKNKIFAITRITLAEMFSNAKAWILIIPFVFALFAFIMQDELMDMSKSYIQMSLISLCLIVMMVYKNILIGSSIMRKTTLPMTHNEKYASLMLTSLITIAAWILFFGIAGAVIFAIMGVNMFDMNVIDSLSDFVAPFLSSRILVYFLYMAMLLLLSVAFAMSKRKRKPIFVELIIMTVLLIACPIVADICNLDWILTPYVIISFVICIIESYRNLKNIESF